MIPLNDDTRWILGRPNFWCASIANVLREDGHDIKSRAEEEQAAVIHWLLNLYIQHGSGWREAAACESDRIRKQVEERTKATTLTAPPKEE